MIHRRARSVREEARAGRLCGPTSGLAAGFVQANIAILPQCHADDFARFCALNARACALLYRSEPGQYLLPALGADIDIRSDLPRYQVHRRGQEAEETLNVRDYWADDLVTFVLGCSFSFEEALLSSGLEVRNISERRNVPMYRTNRPCQPVGPFSANLVVSMRPFAAEQLEAAHNICARFPLVHGAPIHAGDPLQLGIADLMVPDFGDAVSLTESDVAAFWACGVTAIEALRNAQLDFCITHAPGHMLVTDRLNTELQDVLSGEQLHWDPVIG